jgi:hypothetical protein
LPQARPQAFDLPRLALTIPHQTLGQILRRGLLSFASTRAACPCRLTHTLRLSAGRARSLGLLGRRRASAQSPAVARATMTLRGAGRVRAILRLTHPARTRLRGAPRLQGRLEAKLTDRYGRTTLARRAVNLRR